MRQRSEVLNEIAVADLISKGIVFKTVINTRLLKRKSQHTAIPVH